MAEVCVHVCVRVFYVCVCDMAAILQSVTNECTVSTQAVTAQGKLPVLTASPLSSLHLRYIATVALCIQFCSPTL